MVLPRNLQSAGELVQRKLLQDPDAQVRLAAFLALADMPADPRVAHQLAFAWENPANSQDRWIPDAATCAAAQNALEFLQVVAARKADPPLDPKFVEAVGRVAEHYARGGPTDTVGGLLAAPSAGGSPTASIIVDGMARGWPKDRPAKLIRAARAGPGPTLRPAVAGRSESALAIGGPLGQHGAGKTRQRNRRGAARHGPGRIAAGRGPSGRGPAAGRVPPARPAAAKSLLELLDAAHVARPRRRHHRRGQRAATRRKLRPTWSSGWVV